MKFHICTHNISNKSVGMYLKKLRMQIVRRFNFEWIFKNCVHLVYSSTTNIVQSQLIPVHKFLSPIRNFKLHVLELHLKTRNSLNQNLPSEMFLKNFEGKCTSKEKKWITTIQLHFKFFSYRNTGERWGKCCIPFAFGKVWILS